MRPYLSRPVNESTQRGLLPRRELQQQHESVDRPGIIAPTMARQVDPLSDSGWGGEALTGELAVLPTKLWKRTIAPITTSIFGIGAKDDNVASPTRSDSRIGILRMFRGGRLN